MKLDKSAILIKKASLEFDKISNAVLEEYSDHGAIQGYEVSLRRGGERSPHR